ncbi:hypothetical protein PtB15_13B353 [Puccinia triticina]|nr:hypothetical protein PtB15_13B353 [Puccinia triticina]
MLDHTKLCRFLQKVDQIIPVLLSSELQTSTTPGNGPVKTIIQPELVYKEAEDEDGDGVNPLGDPGEEERQDKEPDLLEYMKSVPNVVKTSLDAKLVLLEQALQAQAAGNAALAKLILKAVVEIKPVNESRTLAFFYHNQKFAAKLLQHKANIDEISDKKCFMVGFRYDIQMRAMTFAHRVNDQGIVKIPDITKLKKSVMDNCYDTCRDFQELNWDKNYYAPASPFQNKQTSSVNQSKQYQPNNLGNVRLANQGGSNESKKRTRSGYKGSNFIEGYSKRRSASNPPNNPSNK